VKVRTIAVVGLGYVGTPLAAKLASVGFNVIGYDLDERKVEAINAGKSPLKGREPRLAPMISKAVAAGRLKATTDPRGIRKAEFVTINVQTPFDTHAGKPDYRALESAVATVGSHLKKGAVVVVESTVAPGTTLRVVLPLLEDASAGKAGKRFHLAHCPERVTPGRLLANLEEYDRLVGATDEVAAKACVEVYRKVTRGDVDITDPTTAEVVKTVENAYRDVQIAFANEIALASEAIGVDVQEVRRLVNKVPFRDMHVPGAGVGGHCLPKDGLLFAYGVPDKRVTSMVRLARQINDAMPAHMADLVDRAAATHGGDRASRVVLLGYAFLPDSDDTRNTPAEPLLRRLEAKGYEVRVHDPEAELPGGTTRQKDLIEGCRWADIVVVVTAHSEYTRGAARIAKALRAGACVVDGRGLFGEGTRLPKGRRLFGVGRPRSG